MMKRALRPAAAHLAFSYFSLPLLGGSVEYVYIVAKVANEGVGAKYTGKENYLGNRR